MSCPLYGYDDGGGYPVSAAASPLETQSLPAPGAADGYAGRVGQQAPSMPTLIGEGTPVISSHTMAPAVTPVYATMATETYSLATETNLPPNVSVSPLMTQPTVPGMQGLAVPTQTVPVALQTQARAEVLAAAAPLPGPPVATLASPEYPQAAASFGALPQGDALGPRISQDPSQGRISPRYVQALDAKPRGASLTLCPGAPLGHSIRSNATIMQAEMTPPSSNRECLAPGAPRRGTAPGTAWAKDCSFDIGSMLDRVMATAMERVRLLPREVAGGVSQAVEGLNSGRIQCPEDLCIVFSASQNKHFLLYRIDRRGLALAALGVCGASALVEVFSRSAGGWFVAIVAGQVDGNLTVRFVDQANQVQQKLAQRGDPELAAFGTHTSCAAPPGFERVPSRSRPGQYALLDRATGQKFASEELAWGSFLEQLLG